MAVKARPILVACVLVAGVLSGCASSGPTGGDILTGSIAPATARVVIYRPSAFGFAVQPDYTIDGRVVAGSRPNGFVVCDLKPGEHEIAVNNMALNVNLFGGKDKHVLDLKAGTTTFVEAQIKPGLTVGIVNLMPVQASHGRSETAGMHKIDADCTSS